LVSDEILKQLTDAVVETDSERVKTLTTEAVKAGISPMDIIKQAIAPGLTIIGNKYNEGEAFMLDLMESGECSAAAMEILRPLLKSENADFFAGRVVIGTVEGDLHDIGKNLVIDMFEANVFEVIDIGIDVPPDKFIEAAIKHNADIVGASAIIGPVKYMQGKINEKLIEAGIRDKVKYIIGGWGVSDEWVKQVGADAFGDDAWDGAKKALQLMEDLKQERGGK